MLRASTGIAILSFGAVGAAAILHPRDNTQAAELAPAPRPKTVDPILATSAINVVLQANGGVPPATGEQLWSTLSHVGGFAQLPIVYSGVRLDSGLGNPRVVIAPYSQGINRAEANQPNLYGRLFLAANMEQELFGNPRVNSVEFISWNTATCRFDFGVIENMGSGSPEFHLMDGGRCFACHKNRGPILGGKPWTNSTDLELLRTLVSKRLQIATSGPAAVAAKVRDRIDGMALVSPEAEAVDQAVSIGRQMRVFRETFQLMNRSPAGRRAFVSLLMAIAASGEFDNSNPQTTQQLNAWGNESSYYRTFTNDWLSLLKATNSGVLIDFAPFTQYLPTCGSKYPTIATSSPTVGSGVTSPSVTKFQIESKAANMASQLRIIAEYDEARLVGKHYMPSGKLPSNPKAFRSDLPKPPQKPSNLISPGLLARTLGITRGDRTFLAISLDQAADRIRTAKVKSQTLAKAVFEGPEFADVLAGGPLPDRDEFKDRFVAGLDQLLKTKYSLPDGFHPDRKEYAFGPRYDPKAVPPEVVVTPTTACLRCHDVRPTGKARAFENIPALAFDPLDKLSREAWLKSATKARKQEVLTRLQVRLFKDADMPPIDAPEHGLFRVKQGGAFDEFKKLLEAELAK